MIFTTINLSFVANGSNPMAGSEFFNRIEIGRSCLNKSRVLKEEDKSVSFSNFPFNLKGKIADVWGPSRKSETLQWTTWKSIVDPVSFLKNRWLKPFIPLVVILKWTVWVRFTSNLALGHKRPALLLQLAYFMLLKSYCGLHLWGESQKLYSFCVVIWFNFLFEIN